MNKKKKIVTKIMLPVIIIVSISLIILCAVEITQIVNSYSLNYEQLLNDFHYIHFIILLYKLTSFSQVNFIIFYIFY